MIIIIIVLSCSAYALHYPGSRILLIGHNIDLLCFQPSSCFSQVEHRPQRQRHHSHQHHHQRPHPTPSTPTPTRPPTPFQPALAQTARKGRTQEGQPGGLSPSPRCPCGPSVCLKPRRTPPRTVLCPPFFFTGAGISNCFSCRP